jgi:polyphosphate kinase
LDPAIRQELIRILDIQMADNVKARWLDNDLLNKYKKDNPDVKVRSQIEIYNYLYQQAHHGEEEKKSEIPQIPSITHATGSY